MRFIEGGTLGDAIRRFHEAERQPGRDPGERSVNTARRWWSIGAWPSRSRGPRWSGPRERRR
jgi:hypothetical protein